MLLRFFLVLPLFVVTVFVGIATAGVAVVGWFGALATGRAPRYSRDLVSVYLRLSLRVDVYAAFMSDAFPRFSLDETPDDVVRIHVPEATPLNRWAVLGRIVLVAPAAIVAAVMGTGLVVVEVVMWVVVLASGWLPSPVHDAYRAALRYWARVSAYLLLVVPAYPWGPLGDRPRVRGAVGTSGLGTTMGDAAPADDEIALGPRARAVLIFAIVLGVPLSALSAFVQLGGTSAYQRQQVVGANNTLVSQIDTYDHAARGCRLHVVCLEANDRVLAGELSTFADTLADNEAAGISTTVIDRARRAAQDLAGLLYLQAEAGPSIADYREAVRLDRLDLADQALLQALGGLRTALNS